MIGLFIEKEKKNKIIHRMKIIKRYFSMYRYILGAKEK
jgi:hypothetical protein